MNKLKQEYQVFLSCSWNMRVLLVTNMIYALVMPVIEIFVGAYVMRNSNDVKMVIAYQLAVYTGIPFTFFINGWLLQHVSIPRLYSAGMLFSGLSMAFMMSLGKLSLFGVVGAGLIMGMSFGLYWANRDFLALSSTNDSNRNYYYGLETFFSTNIAIVVPVAIGAFIAATSQNGWFGNNVNHAYQIVTGVVFLLTLISSVVIHQGTFQNPPKTPFIYFRYHWLWNRMQIMAVLKGLGAGFIVTAPAMLIMRLVGQEGTIGLVQSVGGAVSAVLLYLIGRLTGPGQRVQIMAFGLLLFTAGALPNAFLFNATGVLIFMACMLLARPLQDIAYFTIQMRVIDTVSRIENRNEFAYIANQELGYYVGRFSGCMMFILLANYVSDEFALRYALVIVGAVQLLIIPVSKTITTGCDALESAPPPETVAR